MDAKVIPPWKEAVSIFRISVRKRATPFHSKTKGWKQRAPTKQPRRVCMKATAASPSLIAIQDEPDTGPGSKSFSVRPRKTQVDARKFQNSGHEGRPLTEA